MSNRDIHSFNTQNSFDLHLPSTYLTFVQRGVLYSGCRVFNSLPAHIKSCSENSRHFKKILKNYLIEHSYIFNLIFMVPCIMYQFL